MKNVLLLIVAILLLASCATTKGYNYSAHGKRNAGYKHNNERGHYMKCGRH
jgi:uncharacterized protein YxeA